jgi:hypothetical protein
MRSLPGVIPLAGDPPDPVASDQLAMRARSVNNLKQIGLAFHNFHAVNDRFPAAVIYGPDGKPWHSWRVLILPNIDQADLYKEYDFNQPWNSAQNLKLIDKMPDVYRDPAYGDERSSFTHYAALVGPGTVFPPEGARQIKKDGVIGLEPNPRPPRRGLGGAMRPSTVGAVALRDIYDGTSNTLTVAPVEPARKIPWTKPEDINVGPNFPGLGEPGGIATPYTLGGKAGAPGVAPVLSAAGQVHLIVATIKPALLSALWTIDGGEVVGLNDPDSVPLDPLPSRPPTRTLIIHMVGDKATATIE